MLRKLNNSLCATKQPLSLKIRSRPLLSGAFVFLVGTRVAFRLLVFEFRPPRPAEEVKDALLRPQPGTDRPKLVAWK